MEYGNIMVFGASSGLGKAAAEYFNGRCEKLWTISRRAPRVGQWIKTDLAKNEEILHLVQQIGDTTIDGLLYLGGTWETHAFTEAYEFQKCSDEDIENVIQVNLVAPIKLVKHFLPNLRRSDNAKIVFMGALSGLDNYPSPEVANTASKFGLRGVVHSLRQTLNASEIGITVINAGSIGTDEVLSDLKAAQLDNSHAVPLNDFLQILTLILKSSKHTTIKEIDLPNTKGKNA